MPCPPEYLERSLVRRAFEGIRFEEFEEKESGERGECVLYVNPGEPSELCPVVYYDGRIEKGRLESALLASGIAPGNLPSLKL